MEKAVALIHNNYLVLHPSSSTSDTEEVQRNWQVMVWSLAWCKANDNLFMLNSLLGAVKKLGDLLSRLKKEKGIEESMNESLINAVQRQMQMRQKGDVA